MVRKDNLLLKLGVAIYCCTLLMLFFFIDEKYYFEKIAKIQNFWLFVFMALFIAPIFEEISFRGIFVKNKFLNVVSIVLSLFYIIITNNHYLIIFFLSFVIIKLFINKVRFLNYWYLYIINSIIFSLVHYKLNVFLNFERVLPVFIQFSAGLILIWVVINYGLICSMLVHLFMNFLVIIPLFISIQYVDTKEKTTENNMYQLKLVETPILNGSITVFNMPNEREVIIKKANLFKIMNYFNIDVKRYKPVNNPFINYNLQLSTKKEDLKIEESEVVKLFIESKLIEKIE